ncbi:amidohydrolase family protein [Polyangium aurulentum]|uniref:amidohydrolase family protein n=1 Tax=Polyangium aurulentum TaxID=2567896 RepID=UPI0010AE26BB|nr:amidohydrolase family protein [Polyangium aurulentum]UQA59803.1 amidohydrolase [Polyangium aurulentum]
MRHPTLPQALVALALLGCRSEKPPPPAAAPPSIIDVHVHLLEPGAAEPLLSALDRHRIARAVLLGSTTPGAPATSRFRAGNEAVLAAAAAHPDRLIPFVALEPGKDGPAELSAYRGRGACGVKLYVGHQEFHDKPIDDPSFEALWKALEEQKVPTLIHVNTVRYGEELSRVLAAHPNLPALCAHFCGARTDLGRLERLLSAHPRLLVDTSNGSADPAAEGFAGLERQRDRLLALLRASPERFLFGSDLTAIPIGPRFSEEWDAHFAANLGLLQKETFAFWRRGSDNSGLVEGTYRGLALGPELLAPILEGNARRWLGACVR